MQHVTKDLVCQEFVGKLPLPLGEGWGEGPATKLKILFSPFLSERTGKRMEESFLFLLLSYALTPALSQREREFTNSWPTARDV